MNSFLMNFIDDWGRSIKEGLNQTWIVILMVVFTIIALYLMQDILRGSINKSKFVFNRWIFFKILLLIIFTLFAIWFITLV